MALKEVDIVRLESFKRDLDSLGLRFPIAELADKMKMDKGNISAYLNGKKPLSETFLSRFYHAYSSSLSENEKRLQSSFIGVGETLQSYEVNVNLIFEINQLREETEMQVQKIQVCLKDFQAAITAMNALIQKTVSHLEAEGQSPGKGKVKKAIAKKGKPAGVKRIK